MTVETSARSTERSKRAPNKEGGECLTYRAQAWSVVMGVAVHTWHEKSAEEGSRLVTSRRTDGRM